MQMVASGFFGRRADQDAFRPGFADMQLGFVATGEKSGRLEHNIDTEIFPRQRARDRAPSKS